MRHQQSIPEEVLANISDMIPKETIIKPTPLEAMMVEREGGVGQPIFIEGSMSRSFDEAANILIQLLSPSIRDYICELADMTLHIPRWQLLLGSLMAQYESGSITQPSIDPSWRRVDLAIGNSVCTFCGKTFSPKKFGQNVCDQKCGDEKRKMEQLAKNKERDDFQAKLRQAKREQMVI